ncbi:MAG: hypothetical protein P9L89_05390 [Candidatus Celaenobacter polaris]|nr:hypothetical protein [Candidatus Celaenobacter polaris]
MINYKNEQYPQNLELFHQRIMDNCVNLLTLKHYRIQDIFEIDSYGRKQISKEIKALRNNGKEIKGLYSFINKKDEIIYIGISQSIIRRIKQHLYSKYRNQATLAYIMALAEYNKENRNNYLGERIKFPFEKYRINLQERLREQSSIIIQRTEDNFELYYSEILYCCYYKPFWNTFETH